MRWSLLAWSFALFVCLAFSCSSPDIDGQTWLCESDEDCGSGFRCVDHTCQEGQGVAPPSGGCETCPDIATMVRVDCIDDPPPRRCIYESEHGLGQWVLLQPGAFQMGAVDDQIADVPAEEPRLVRFSAPLLVKGTELTMEQWAEQMGDPLALADDPDCDMPECPARGLTWWAAVDACNMLSRKEELEECYVIDGCRNDVDMGGFVCEFVQFRGVHCEGYRLPTEAEWEYAARAGGDTPFPGGDFTDDENRTRPLGDCAPEDEALAPVAWYCDNAEGVPHPVHTREPNDWALFDMNGNVWEWCHDGFGTYAGQPVEDPIGTESAESRVRRGGAWNSIPREASSTHRGQADPAGQREVYRFTGVRPVRSLATPP